MPDVAAWLAGRTDAAFRPVFSYPAGVRASAEGLNEVLSQQLRDEHDGHSQSTTPCYKWSVTAAWCASPCWSAPNQTRNGGIVPTKAAGVLRFRVDSPALGCETGRRRRRRQ